MTQTDPARAVPHVAALDGLRGVAVLLVMIHHFLQGVPLTRPLEQLLLGAHKGLWVGVDLFFALSGFLITGILLETRGASNALRAFYGRRILRIFPLYYLFLALVFLLLPRLGLALAPRSGQDQAWFWLYGSNLLTAERGWQDRIVHHFWSLAAEEQYYLIWPFCVLFLPPRGLAGALLGAVGLGAWLRWAGAQGGAEATWLYTFPLAHLDAICLGSLLGLAARSPLRRRLALPDTSAARLACDALVLALALALALGDLSWPTWGAAGQALGYTAVALGACFLVWVAASGGRPTLTRRLLERRPLRFFGQLSYGLYVLHIPVAMAGETWLAGLLRVPALQPWCPALLYVALLTAASVLLAWLSWRGIESRFLRWKRYFPYR